MMNDKCENCIIVNNNLNYSVQAEYDVLEIENKELKMLLRKFTHEMGNALTILGASIFYVEADIARGVKECNLRDLKNDYSYICGLFNSLREYNHAEGVNKKYIEISELINEMDSSFHKIPGNENVLFGIYSQDSIKNKKIYADFVKIKQAFINIIKNAVEAVSENKVEKGKQVRISLTVENDDFIDMVHIEIMDNGKGISKKNMSKIFEPLFTYGKKNGTGLGLTIVKKIIKDHEGKVKAVSALGTGTAMHIYLPVIK